MNIEMLLMMQNALKRQFPNLSNVEDKRFWIDPVFLLEHSILNIYVDHNDGSYDAWIDNVVRDAVHFKKNGVEVCVKKLSEIQEAENGFYG